MDLRDQFAMAALQGFLANPHNNMVSFENAAAAVYEYADAIIAEREKGSVDSVYSIKQQLTKAIKQIHGLDVSGLHFLTAGHLVFILQTGQITSGQ